MTVTLLSGATRRKAFGANASAVAASARRGGPAQLKPMVRPAAAATVAFRKLRRPSAAGFGSGSMAKIAFMASAFQRMGGRVDGGADADISGAAADIAAHRVVDVGVGRLRVLLEQRRRRHDLTGLAIAALRHLEVDPGRLHGLGRLARQALEGRDMLLGNGGDRRDARARRLAIDMHRTGPALRRAAAELGAVQADDLADRPEQGHVGISVDRGGLAVERERNRHKKTPTGLR